MSSLEPHELDRAGFCIAHPELMVEVKELCGNVGTLVERLVWVMRLGRWIIGLAGALLLLWMSFGGYLIISDQKLIQQISYNTARIDMLCQRIFGTANSNPSQIGGGSKDGK